MLQNLVRPLLTVMILVLAFGCRSRSPGVVKALTRPMGASEVIYFVVTDRFADGDPANNHGGYKDLDWRIDGYEPTQTRMFHGGDLKGLLGKLDYISSLGATAIWLTPFQENLSVQGDGTLAASSAGYHGYWIKNFLKVDPHLGTEEDLQKFIVAAHQRGIKVFADFVFNHTADFIGYRECQGTAPSETCPFNRAGYTPIVASRMEHSKNPEWMNDTHRYHNQGSSVGGRVHPSDFGNLDKLNGDIAGLDDLNTEDTQVQSGLVDIYGYWISQFRFDGVRVDTVRHAPLEFWSAVIPDLKAVAQKSGITDFYIFAEAWDSFTDTESRRALSRYVTDGPFDGILDFSFQRYIRDVASGKKLASDFKAYFYDDTFYGKSAPNQLVTFTGNHDVGRLATFLRADGVPEAEILERAKLAHAFQLLSRGIPVLFYGDEQGFAGDGGDADAREDMFATKVPQYLDNKLIGTTATHLSDSFNPQHVLFRHMKDLIELRNQHPELSRGTTEWIEQPNPNLALFQRCLSAECTVVGFNFSSTVAMWNHQSIEPWNWKILGK